MPKMGSKRSKGKAEPPKPTAPMPRHQFVPPHELLTREESAKVLQRLGTPVERLPKIRRDDRGLQTDSAYRAALEASEDLAGRLVRVRRHSQTAGDIEIYRVIVAGAGE